MLVLFDIDGTMLSSEGVGVRSIEQAGEAMFGKPFSLSGLPIGGRLDPLIWKDACARHDIEDHTMHHDAFRRCYTEILRTNLEQTNVTVLPGVTELIEKLVEHDHTLGLVTGNYEETGLMKLEAAGIDTKPFVANAWGTDGNVRADLPPHALAQHNTEEPVVLIGDTEHDVTSGHAAGCRVIAVCTGSHDCVTLERVKPDLLVADLTDTEAIFKWMVL
ncbi:MAG: HAD hydrolase-like protein [Phycisphaerales bacterium]|jgi:phosphoglycolate phosphatase-like HAD superfamily hydrolase|nr:HAD hydrolase-like protein [Phycisphaerales bacterium]